MRMLGILEDIARRAIKDALDIDADPLLRQTSDAKLGDFQVNAALPLAKAMKKAPRDLAMPIAEKLRAESCFAKVEVAGPGFVNLTLSPAWLAQTLTQDLADTTRDGVPLVAQPETIAIDFSGPNIAKQMHVGHLRSTIIGASLVSLLRFLGHRVIGDNHLGDWGTQFGLLIVGMREFGDEAALAENAIVELERVYKAASARAKEDEPFADAARAELAKLQSGDPENRALWERFIATTRTALDRVYKKLNVEFDEWLGESAYDAMLPGVVDLLLKENIATEDQGAICVFFKDDPELGNIETPYIIRKKDGAFLYSTSDVATLLYRRDHFKADRSLYVVDARQALHFKQLFAVSRKLGLTMKLAHISFGSVLDEHGKPLKTRDGKAITLESLLDEAVARSLARIREEGLDVPEAELQNVANAVGVGAVKYADLRQNRSSDYQFDWEKMISFKGNAGPYLQYAYARIQSIFRKGDIAPASLNHALLLSDPTEIALAKELAKFGDVLWNAADAYHPHLICDHLYAVARLFSSFYEACPILKAENDESRSSRAALAWLTGRQLARGLAILGLEVVDKM